MISSHLSLKGTSLNLLAYHSHITAVAGELLPSCRRKAAKPPLIECAIEDDGQALASSFCNLSPIGAVHLPAGIVNSPAGKDRNESVHLPNHPMRSHAKQMKIGKTALGRGRSSGVSDAEGGGPSPKRLLAKRCQRKALAAGSCCRQ